MAALGRVARHYNHAHCVSVCADAGEVRPLPTRFPDIVLGGSGALTLWDDGTYKVIMNARGSGFSLANGSLTFSNVGADLALAGVKGDKSGLRVPSWQMYGTLLVGQTNGFDMTAHTVINFEQAEYVWIFEDEPTPRPDPSSLEEAERLGATLSSQSNTLGYAAANAIDGCVSCDTPAVSAMDDDASWLSVQVADETRVGYVAVHYANTNTTWSDWLQTFEVWVGATAGDTSRSSAIRYVRRERHLVLLVSTCTCADRLASVAPACAWIVPLAGAARRSMHPFILSMARNPSSYGAEAIREVRTSPSSTQTRLEEPLTGRWRSKSSTFIRRRDYHSILGI